MDGAPAHDSKERSHQPESRRGSSRHEGQGPALRTGDTARHRRIHELKTGCLGIIGRFPGAGNVDGRAIQQDGSGAHRRNDLRGS